MIILEVKAPRKHMQKIVTDQGEFSLDSDTVGQHRLKKGVWLTEEQLSGLKLHSDCTRALSKGSWLLSQRDYTSKGLGDKLRQQFGEYAAEYAVGALTEVGALDDTRYAENMAQYYAEYKSLSKKAIVRELTLRGVDRETAQNAADALEYDQTEAAAQLILRKYNGWNTDEKVKRRMTAALLRKGFSYSQINDAVKQITQSGGTDGI